MKDLHLHIQFQLIVLQISDYNMTPDVSSLSEGLRTCLQESEEVPTDFTQLFHTQVGHSNYSSICFACLITFEIKKTFALFPK